ncbi:polysaccharide deacetylase family protein [Pseudoruegeria sp. SK021]|uniref:polysaccharide deacetylase family protein n=1 Tax=Pseudoruegeria sp. SK021 TaxID=1933035 RepID=UPI000A22966D|nr:polysaccharide deacetylase family protein [Pseudoruegeria sp. SK021]OSP54709.1 chitin deacetylase [Pseudoruegeria sp. SK021]
MTDGRDFLGYGACPPRVVWPGDAPVAVSFVLNIEEGAERAISSGDDRNESAYEVVDEVIGQRDFCMESHFEYGPRAGYWRIARLFAEYGVPLTLNLCGRALVRTPWLGRHAIAAGHEAMCHGWLWQHHNHMDEAEERATIQRCVDTFQDILGTRPRGWHVKSHPSPQTRRLLMEEGGFLYDSNAYNDDLPTILHRDPGYVVLPYSFDTNDMQFFNTGRFVHGADFARYCCDAFDWLASEDVPKMMTVGLHTRIIGRPGRIGGLKALLEHISRRNGWIARRDAIAQTWLTQLA